MKQHLTNRRFLLAQNKYWTMDVKKTEIEFLCAR